MKQVCKYFHYHHPSSYVFYGHRHAEWELNAVLSGCMEITAEDNVERLFSTEAVLIRGNDLHQNRVIGNSGAEMLVIHFTPDAFDTCDDGLYKLSADALALINLLINEAERGGIYDSEVKDVSENTKKLLDLLLCELARGEKAGKSYGDKDSEAYRCAVEFMKQNIDRSLDIEAVARACGVCKTTIKKVFSYYTGMGCMQFFGEMKLKRAKKLIESGFSCADAADKLGFSSLAYFSKKYKDFYGTSPSLAKIKTQNKNPSQDL